MLWYVGAYLLAINLFTMAAFGLDKRSAERGGRRTPEADLLSLALIGGAPGAWAAMRLFRHKTKKPPFRSRLALIGTLQIAALLALVWWRGG